MSNNHVHDSQGYAFADWLIARAGGMNKVKSEFCRFQLRQLLNHKRPTEVTMEDILGVVKDNNWKPWFRKLTVLDLGNIFGTMRMDAVNPATYTTQAPLTRKRGRPRKEAAEQKGSGKPRGRPRDSEDSAKTKERVWALFTALQARGSLTRKEIQKILDVKSPQTVDKVIDLMVRHNMIAKTMRGHTHVFIPTKREQGITAPTTEAPPTPVIAA